MYIWIHLGGEPIHPSCVIYRPPHAGLPGPRRYLTSDPLGKNTMMSLSSLKMKSINNITTYTHNLKTILNIVP